MSTTDGRRDNDQRPLVRVRKGDALCTSHSSGRSSSGSFQEETWGSFMVPKVGPVAAGEQITIEAFIPTTHRVEFLFPRPEYPGTAAH
jgi:hypothetical protein